MSLAPFYAAIEADYRFIGVLVDEPRRHGRRPHDTSRRLARLLRHRIECRRRDIRLLQTLGVTA